MVVTAADINAMFGDGIGGAPGATGTGTDTGTGTGQGGGDNNTPPPYQVNNTPGNQYWDHLNANLGPNPTEGGKHGPWNIDDPNWYLPDDPEKPQNGLTWSEGPLHLTHLPADTPEPKDCWGKCTDMAKKRQEKCKILRKRVAAALKGAGCPSKVTPYSTGVKICKNSTTKKKTATKKKTTSKKK